MHLFSWKREACPGHAPDIYLLALDAINIKLDDRSRLEECLDYEDTVPGVEAGRRDRMRVVWVPHPKMKIEYRARETELLMRRCGMWKVDDKKISWLGEVDDGFGHCLESLLDFFEQCVWN